MKTIVINNNNIIHLEKVKMVLDYMEQNSIEYDYQSFIPVNTLGRKLDRANNAIIISALIFGLIGFFTALLFQYWASMEYFRQNIGNREFFSWVTSIPIAFELAVLLAALSAFIVFILAIKLRKNKFHGLDSDNFLIFISHSQTNVVIDFLKNNNIDFKIIAEDDKN